MFKRILTAALVFGAVATAPPVVARTTCGQRENIVGQLSNKYAETLTGGGLKTTQSLLELWTSPKTGTWTLIITQANGVSCVVGSGTNWHLEKVVAKPDGIKS